MTETAASSSSNHYLTFRLGEEMFCMDVANVREVLDITTITKVPGMPDYMRGIINVRDTVVPVTDLSLRFGLPEKEKNHETRIIILELISDEESFVAGMMADAVHEVKVIEPDQIEKPPKAGSGQQTDYIKGIGKSNGQFILVLDIEKVFASEKEILNDIHASIQNPESDAALQSEASFA